MASEETKSLTESCSDTRSKRGSEDRVNETESVSIESVVAKSQPRNSAQMSGATSKRTQMERKYGADYVNMNMPTSEQRVA